MLKKTAFVFLLSLISPLSQACTIWASLASANKDEQLLLLKNRDAPADSIQNLQLVTPPEGYRYLALMYKNKPSDPAFIYISAGINQPGLNVADNDVYTPTPYTTAVGSAIMQDILQHYASVEQVLQAKDQLFSHGAGQNLVIADSKQIITVEIAPDGHYAIDGPISQGYLFHTNHFLNPTLIPYNDPVSSSTFIRYNHISALLASGAPFTQALFEGFAKDQSRLNADGSIDTNNNILRKFTQATWFIGIPKAGPAHLHLQEFDVEQASQDIDLTLDNAFWQQSST